MRSIHAEKKVLEEEHLVRDLNKQVFTDALTSVRNKGAFANYIQQMQDGLENGGATEFAIGVFDCDDLKSVNDQHGHDKGDLYLKTACRLICRVFQHSPVFRIGGDEFAVILQNDDYRNWDELIRQFDRTRLEISASAQNQWEQVHVAMGVAVFDAQVDQSVIETVQRAEKVMYTDKRVHKKALE